MKKQTLLLILITVLLVACGTGTSPTEDDPSPEMTSPATETPISEEADIEEPASEESPQTEADPAVAEEGEKDSEESVVAEESASEESITDESEGDAAESIREQPELSGYYKLQTNNPANENQCLAGNFVADDSVLGGSTFMDDCADVSGQDWTFSPSEEVEGYFYLQTAFAEENDQCLESNLVAEGAFLDGAAYMADCEYVSGQLWQLLDVGDGYYQLQSNYVEDQNLCLEGNVVADDSDLGGAAFMADCGAFAGQYWQLVSVDDFEFIEVEDESETAVPFGVLSRIHIVELSELIGTRPAGSEEETKAGKYIASIFESFGYEPKVQTFTEGDVSSANIIATKEGLSEETIIIGAHYDTVSVGQGADDNASGVAIMLEAAERLQAVETPYTIKFIAFGAEEIGLVGSTYYVSQMSEVEIVNSVVMVNLDSLIAGDNAYVHGDGVAGAAIRDWLIAWAEAEGLPLQIQTGENPDYPAGTTGDWSDHAPFKEIGIPYVYFESTNWSLGNKDGYTQVEPQYGINGEIWHTKFDYLRYIESLFPGRIDERLELFAHALHKISSEYTTD